MTNKHWEILVENTINSNSIVFNKNTNVDKKALRDLIRTLKRIIKIQNEMIDEGHFYVYNVIERKRKRFFNAIFYLENWNEENKNLWDRPDDLAKLIDKIDEKNFLIQNMFSSVSEYDVDPKQIENWYNEMKAIVKDIQDWAILKLQNL